MKDLYRRNHLQPLEEDSVKINNCQGEVLEDSEAAYAVLLNSTRKQEYDKVYKVLSSIADLREHFDLSKRNRWNRQYSDFASKHHPATETLVNDTKEPGQAKSHGLAQGNIFKIIASVSFAVFALIFFMSNKDGENNEFDHGVTPTFILKHSTINDLPAYESPNAKSAVVKEIMQFEDVRVLDRNTKSDWDILMLDSKQAYVQRSYLSEGGGELAYIQYCRRFGSSRPDHATSLYRVADGPHTLIVINPPGDDAIIKLKNRKDQDVIFYYLHGAKTLTLNDVPQGEFQFFYATGKEFSQLCGLFLENMQAWKEVGRIDFATEGSAEREFATTVFYSLKDFMSKNARVDAREF